MKDYIKLIRLKHSIKNLLIFLPLFFSGLIFNWEYALQTFYGFICFTLIACCIYIINDIKDYDLDKNHPIKKNRPIASGRISIKQAIIYFLCIFIIANILIWAIKMPTKSIILLYVYLVANLGYSFKLKNIPLLDIAILVLGFIIRLMFGASLLNIQVSNWLLLTVIAISFYMGLGKRRNEIGTNTRKVLKYYNKEFLDKNMYMLLSCAIVFYSLWTIDANVALETNNMLVWTIPMIIILSMRYSMDIEKDVEADPVEVITSDKYLIILTLITAISIFSIIYLF